MVSLPFLSLLRSLISDLAGLVADIPFFARLRHLWYRNRMRLEDEITEGRYVVCAEIPGIDPANVDITADVEQLTIKAERSQEPESSGRDARVALRLLIDTGRRPAEICNLPRDCLDQDQDGK